MSSANQLIRLCALTMMTNKIRYKCIGLNGAGQSNFEFVLQVGRAPESTAAKASRDSAGLGNFSSAPARGNILKPSPGRHQLGAPATRDQRANAPASWSSSELTTGTKRTGQQQNQHQHQTQFQLQQRHHQPVTPGDLAVGKGEPTGGQQASSSLSQSAGWLKGSATFQIVMVIVSVLMGAVILAFLLVCVVIYQIKPAPRSSILLPAIYSKQTDASNNVGNSVVTTTVVGPIFGSPGQFNPTANGLGSTSNANANNHSSSSFGSRPLILANANHVDSRLAQSSTLNTINSSLISTDRRLTPILTAVCDPISGQMPVHLLVQQPTQQTPVSACQTLQQQQLFEDSSSSNWPNGTIKRMHTRHEQFEQNQMGVSL